MSASFTTVLRVLVPNLNKEKQQEKTTGYMQINYDDMDNNLPESICLEYDVASYELYVSKPGKSKVSTQCRVGGKKAR